MDKFNRFNKYKILIYADRIQKILKGEFPAPVVMHVYLSNRCPFSCTFCIMKDEKRKYPVMLAKKILFRIVQESIQNDIKLIHFSGGGEPLCHPDIYSAIEMAHKGGIKVAVSTNGYLMTKPDKITLADHIRISLNSGTPEIHQRSFGTTVKYFSQIIRNIKAVVAFRKRYHRHVDIGLGFVITPENWLDIYNFCRVASECVVDFVHIRPAYLKDKKQNEFLKAIVPSALSLAETARGDFKNIDIFCTKEKFDGYWTPRLYDKCRASPLQAVLTATGAFIICQDVFIRFGDYNKDNFWKCWDSEGHRKAIAKVDIVKCPRCVENIHNEIIQEVFMRNKIKSELI
jgi:MoaA/NifB/PqqE/SkfB family radical SAM enzyme